MWYWWYCTGGAVAPREIACDGAVAPDNTGGTGDTGGMATSYMSTLQLITSRGPLIVEGDQPSIVVKLTELDRPAPLAATLGPGVGTRAHCGVTGGRHPTTASSEYTATCAIFLLKSRPLP